MKTKLVIFGITGDLSRRMILPALEQILSVGACHDLEIIGVSRGKVDAADLIENSVGKKSRLRDLTLMFQMNLEEIDDYRKLKNFLRLKNDEQLLAYMSVPPASATRISDNMGEVGLNTSNVKVLFEKPFGVDLESAKDAIERTRRYFSDDQVYRIDHYLEKDMAQNIIVYRGANAIFNHLWDRNSIDSVEIIASERIGIEGRANFYEQTGALRDVLQGHLMQLLALALLDIPKNMDWSKLPERRLAALEAIRPVNPLRSIRAQYDTYTKEVNNPDSMVETFVAVDLESTAERWEGVPIRLITGKALPTKTTEIRVQLKKYHESQSNAVVFHIQPNEGIAIELLTKTPEYEHKLEQRVLGFSYSEDTRLPNAYEHVLVDAINGKKNMFATGDEVIRSWEILQPLLNAWDFERLPLAIYKKNTDPLSPIHS